MSENRIASMVYINLDMRPDRNEFMKKQLQACPWPNQRIAATRLTVEPESLGIKLNDYAKNMPHVASIFLSHRNALAELLEVQDDGLFVVLEDDVNIDPILFELGLDIPDNVPADWEMALISVRYKKKKMLVDPETGAPTSDWEWEWVHNPLGSHAAGAKDVRKRLTVTGTHFCLFNGKASITKILDKMRNAKYVYDVDGWYMDNSRCYLWDEPRIGTANFGSDHDGGID